MNCARKTVSTTIESDIQIEAEVAVDIKVRRIAAHVADLMGECWPTLPLERVEWWEQVVIHIVSEINDDPDNFDVKVLSW